MDKSQILQQFLPDTCISMNKETEFCKVIEDNKGRSTMEAAFAVYTQFLVSNVGNDQSKTGQLINFEGLECITSFTAEKFWLCEAHSGHRKKSTMSLFSSI